MRMTRETAGPVLLVGAIVVTIVMLIYPSMKGTQATAAQQTTQTPYGPLTAADRDFVVKVRLAGLWEFPSGQRAVQIGTTAAVRTAGEHLIHGHEQLDAMARDVAQRLGITLPNQPTPQQQGFLATLTAATGTDFDTKLANILRVTHGQIFTAIAKIRATTKNTLVRQLASQANDTVLDHITVMENTGLVNIDGVVDQITASPHFDPSFTTPPTPSPGQPTFIVTESPSPSVSPTTG